MREKLTLLPAKDLHLRLRPADLQLHDKKREPESRGFHSSLYDQLAESHVWFPQGVGWSGQRVMNHGVIVNHHYVNDEKTLLQRFLQFMYSLEGLAEHHHWTDGEMLSFGLSLVLRPLEVR